MPTLNMCYGIQPGFLEQGEVNMAELGSCDHKLFFFYFFCASNMPHTFKKARASIMQLWLPSQHFHVLQPSGLLLQFLIFLLPSWKKEFGRTLELRDVCPLANIPSS